MSAFGSAWALLKNFDEKRGPMRVDPDGIDGPTTQEELDASDTVFYEDYGPVPAADYYNADWHINHPNSHIHEDLPPRDELQAQLDKEKEMADYRKVMDAPPPRRTPQMDDDPFRMKKPDMSAQIEQMLAEIQRREGRRNPDFHDQDYDSFYDRDKYDRENPQDNQLLNTTRPQMNDRMEALRAEMVRRARKRGSPVEGDFVPPQAKGPQQMGAPESFSPPALDPSTEEYERAFDKKHADMQSFSAPEGMTNEKYGIIDQPDSNYTKELQGQALQDYIKQRFG